MRELPPVPDRRCGGWHPGDAASPYPRTRSVLDPEGSPLRTPPRRLAAALLALPLLVLTACGEDETPTAAGAGATASPTASPTGAPTAAASPSATYDTDLGVTVAGAFGEKPTLEVPEGEAPAELEQEVLSEGDGEQVEAGDVAVVHYLGQTWAPRDGEPNVFDNSFDRGQPFATPVGLEGTAQVIQGWNTGLVGQQVGSRVLLSIPPEQAYGPAGSGHDLAGETLLFVIDVIDAFGADEAATGTPVELPAGFPEIRNEPGEKPEIVSVEGVEAPSEPTSALLLEGDGEPIDPAKTLALQIVATDFEGTQSEESWGTAVQTLPAGQVLQIADALEGQNVGSRAAVLLPPNPPAEGATAAPTSAGSVVVLDVVGQY